MSLPEFDVSGDLPPGVHVATLSQTLDRLGQPGFRRRLLARRVERVWLVAASTGHLARFILFGSFVTNKAEPGDIDVFMLMDDAFDVRLLQGEARLLFTHGEAQAHFGASVFWVRRLAAFGGEEELIGHWQIRRDGGRRGIVEVVEA